jgi:hypothetical protein
MFSVVTPKWREPTRVIRMVFDPFRARRPVDNTSSLSVTPGAPARAGYQQVG